MKTSTKLLAIKWALATLTLILSNVLIDHGRPDVAHVRLWLVFGILVGVAFAIHEASVRMDAAASRRNKRETASRMENP